MRFLLTFAVVTLIATVKSDKNNFETGTENTTTLRSHENHNDSAARREEAFQLVVAIAKNFSAKYFTAVAGSTFKSRACSPLSAFFAASILSYGAQGNTRRKLLKGLGFWGHKPQTVKQGLRKLIDNFINYEQVELRVKNKMYVPTGLLPNAAFAELAKKFFHLSIESIDLRYECQTAAKVNGWVANGSNKTYIGPDPTIALVNEVHLKGTWQTGFDVSQTRHRFFDVNGHDRIMMKTMYTFGRFRYGKVRNLDATFIELPYKSDGPEDGISVFIFLTNKYEGYRPIVHETSKIDVRSLLNRAKKNVHVFLPKFKIEADIRSDMWMPEFFGSEDPFEPPTNFSKIFNSPGLSFSGSLDKVVVEFDENGDSCKAIAREFLQTRSLRSVREAPEFRFEVNRPFVVKIVTTGKHIIDLVTINISGNTFSRRQTNKDETIH